MHRRGGGVALHRLVVYGPSFKLGRFHPSMCLQMLAWMQNPVPASRVSLSLKCEAPTDISPDVGSVCATYVG